MYFLPSVGEGWAPKCRATQLCVAGSGALSEAHRQGCEGSCGALSGNCEVNVDAMTVWHGAQFPSIVQTSTMAPDVILQYAPFLQSLAHFLMCLPQQRAAPSQTAGARNNAKLVGCRHKRFPPRSKFIRNTGCCHILSFGHPLSRDTAVGCVSCCLERDTIVKLGQTLSLSQFRECNVHHTFAVQSC